MGDNTRMYGGTRFVRGWYKKSFTLLIVFAYAIGLFEPFLTFLPHAEVPVAEAAQATIDSTPSAVGTSHIQSGAQTVFVNDQTGYKFFIDAPGFCVYSKTTNGGASWSATTTVDSQTDCVAISVWYDQWTPGMNSASTSIHIATLDTSSDDIFYNRLDTDGDTLLLGTTPTSTVVATAQGGTITAGQNQVTITRATDGSIYAASIDGSDSYVVRCNNTCNRSMSWTEAGTNPFGLTNNYTILAPLPGGNILAIHRDVILEDMGSKVYNAGTNSWDTSTTTFDTNAPDNTTYDVGMAMTVSSTTGTIYLAYAASNTTPGADDLVRTARYSSGSWTTTKEVVRYTEKGITNVAIALDQSNDDIYVAYTARVLPTIATSSNVYWRKSSDNMASWSYEYGPIDASVGDLYGLDLNIMSEERIYASWFDLTNTDLYGETLADIYPGVHVTAEAFDEVNGSDSYTQNTLDVTGHANGTSNLMSGAQTVFISDQVGYKFFRDAPGYCVYTKTTNGGTSWSATTSVDSQTDCIQITVWYDGWTPGLSSASTSIHIVTSDTTSDDLWYNRLDTTSDTRLMGAAPVSMTTAQGGSLTEGENFVSITRATNGVLYAISNDGTTGPDSFIVECTVSCGVAGNWSETGTNPLDAASDQNLLLPLFGDDVLVLNRDIDLDDLRARTWDDSAATWTPWTVIDTSAAENATYDVGMAGALSTTTGYVYVAYLANNDAFGTNDQVRTALYRSGTWASTTAVSTSTVLGLTNVALALDASSDDVYVAYSARATAATAGTGNILWKRSQDDMASWGYEQGPVNTTPDDMYGVDMARIGSDRVYVTWYDATDDDIYGATLVDLPFTPPATTSRQTASTTASTTNVYIGGKFAFYNTTDAGSLDITGIVVSESGTIDGSIDVSNVRLYYETDTVSPRDCAAESYDGSEAQFGSTDTNGFSGADGVSSFSGTSVSVSTTTTMCVYVVLDIIDSALSSSTIEISIANPSSDVTVTGSTAGPTTDVSIPGQTFIYNDTPTLKHYHWRTDSGTEATSTSRTNGIEDTPHTALQQGTTTRLRVQVSNEGSTSTGPMQYRLEYGTTTSACDATTFWTQVNANGEFMMADSVHLINGTNTTNIATALGGLSDENTTFKTPNGGVLDTTSETGALNLSPTEFVELEYSIMASTTAPEGTTYCFRVTNAGAPLSAYTVLPRVNISADVLVTATSSQISPTTTPVSNFYIGGAYVITDNVDTRTVSSITITENGTVDGQTGLDNIKLRYDLDTTAPYNCVSESFSQSDTQFGATDTDGFSGPNGTSTFTGSVVISTTSPMCVYVVVDSTATAQNGETIDIILENPSVNVVVSSGSVSPTVNRDITGSTTLVGPVLTQTHYHWRNDNGTQATATSMTNGNEDTPVDNIALTLPVRLRMQVSNEGSVSTTPASYRLEYGAKITTCSAIGSWTDVGQTGGAWDMYDSIHLIDATNTTNIATALGGMTDENATFKTPNSAEKDTSSVVATTTLSSADFLEAEFSMIQTTSAGYDVTYCFRLTHGGSELGSYLEYPELTTAPERDFEIQRNTAVFTGTSTTLVAGVDYVAPAASSSAFVRITNSHHTGAGSNGAGATQNADDVTAYIANASDIRNSFTIQRPSTAAATSSRVSWEIVEFIGTPGSDNEIIVRGQGFVTYGTGSTTATGTAYNTVSDDSDVVVFITGQMNPDIAALNYNSGQSTSAWDATNNVPVFTRGMTGSDASVVSYAVVEFTGQNWQIQRSEHTYTSAGVTETEPITAVGSLARTFLHTQKRLGTNASGTDEFGHEVWLSSVGFISFVLESGASFPSQQTTVAWVIENVQTSSGSMVVTRSAGSTNAGTSPFTLSVPINTTLDDLTNASLFAVTRAAGTGTNFPRPIIGATIASTTHWQLWRSNTGANLTYRAETVEWPTAGLALRQNYYRFYYDNNALTPTDPWPQGGSDLGENTVLGGSDEPLGEGERLRIRMSIAVRNATLPTSTLALKLQYAPLSTTCSAITEGSWATLGNSASSTIWRGYSATGTTDGTDLSSDPPTPGDLLLSVSDVAGSLEEENDSVANSYSVDDGEDIEYDWIVEQNGANAETYYCFRAVEADGTPLASYLQYPQVRTASFTPRTQDWRWYDDEYNETPTSSIAAINTAPVDVSGGDSLVLRITVNEIKNIARDDVRFKLQYSEYANFSTSSDVLATSTCTASSTWCYVAGAGVDNAVVSSTTLLDTDTCTLGVGDGCGTHNESPSQLTGYRHENSAAAEYSFTIQSVIPRVNTVYYFRLYDLTQDIPVPPHDGESYPSLVTEGASLTFGLSSVASSTVTEGVTLDIGATATSIPYGRLTLNTDYEAAQRFVISTNAPEGYYLYMTTPSELMNSSGSIFTPITGTNGAPVAWNTGCAAEAAGCFGYHTGDDTLSSGSTRFAANDTYARFSTTTLDEVIYTGAPVTNETVDIIFRIKARALQAAGQYTTHIRYISVPSF